MLVTWSVVTTLRQCHQRTLTGTHFLSYRG